ncbi:MAG TPA: type II secretion system protein N [Burkholderiaceae bacterium]|nr:type II secretion system protein N [Burkholderiaceae bacterium]
MQAPWSWAIIGGVLGILIACILFAPAAWLNYSVKKYSNDRIVLNDAQGSVWQGSAQLLLSGGAGSRDATTLPGRIRWQIRPQIPYNVHLELNADCCTSEAFQILLIPKLSGILAEIKPSQSTWPATLLSGLGAPFNTIDLQAMLKLQTQQFHLSWLNQQFKLDGQAELDIIDASTRLSTLKPVGSYRIGLQGGTIPKINVQTLNGSLLLSGTGEFTENHWRFRGEATAAPGSEAALNNFLDILGRRVGPRSLITLG